MKEYSNQEIKVLWSPEKCIHARECVKGLPGVFNRENTPWINMQGASSEDIMKVIDRCPSGALTYEKTKTDSKESEKMADATIKAKKNGPLLVEGDCILQNSDGKVLADHGPYALCRCGGSAKKPLCDGSHLKIAFDDTN